MLTFLRRYASWLHTGWPSGAPPDLPRVGRHGETNVPGLLIAGDLGTGTTLKAAADSSVRAVRALPAPAKPNDSSEGLLDLVIVGAGPAGVAGAIEARKSGLRFELIEAHEPFSTVSAYPDGKPVILVPDGGSEPAEFALDRPAVTKRELLDRLRGALTASGVSITRASVTAIQRREEGFEVSADDGVRRCRRVLVATGRGSLEPGKSGEALLRSAGVRFRLAWTPAAVFGAACFFLFCLFLYNWKGPNSVLPVFHIFDEADWFPFAMDLWVYDLSGALGRAVGSPHNILHTIAVSAQRPGFHYALAYSIVLIIFGIRRIRRSRDAYVTRQTICFTSIQVFPLFLLPEILLPWAGANGWFLEGTVGGRIAGLFFEAQDGIGVERAYWRSYGFILAWPLFVWNWFTDSPLWAWLVLGMVQTFVVIPWLVRRFGKGAYCSWICSCGALAETLADGVRHRMPHGPAWNRLNLLGQGILAAALILLLLRVLAWIFPQGVFGAVFLSLFQGIPFVHYSWFIDVFLSGVLGAGLYFALSGRIWCRLACPLAALMHVYARLGRFRIFSRKERCISCGDCTRICHQGIDVMGFARDGVPLADPQCVRCSSCIRICPTGVLSFGRTDRHPR